MVLMLQKLKQMYVDVLQVPDETDTMYGPNGISERLIREVIR